MSSPDSKPLSPTPPSLEMLASQIQHASEDTSWRFLGQLALALPVAVAAYFAAHYLAGLALGTLHVLAIRFL